MLSNKEIITMSKGTKIISRANLYKAKQKAGQKQSTAGAGEQCCEISQPAQVTNFRNLRRLRIFATLQDFH